MAAGFGPGEFWAQSPRSFVTIMEGAARAAKRKQEATTAAAWQTGMFSGLASCGKLKALDHYLPQKPKAQTPEQMLAVLKGMAGSGTPMSIRQVN